MVFIYRNFVPTVVSDALERSFLTFKILTFVVLSKHSHVLLCKHWTKECCVTYGG